MNYTPTKNVLEKYAAVLINFALGGGKGVKKGEVVFIQVPECAKPILVPLRQAVLKAGAHPITEYIPDDISRHFYEEASKDQLEFFPAKYMKGKVDEMDHIVSIIAETNKYELKGIDPAKIMARNAVFKPYKDWRDAKENKGKMTWTLALYGTLAMAKEARLSQQEYWGQIIKACYLDAKDPVKKWKDVAKEVERVRGKLNKLPIKKLRIQAQDTDLTIGIDNNRRWLGGSGRNIPSFEVFISPDWRRTEGYISFNQPLYRYGNKVDGISLIFNGGKVVSVKAKEGLKVISEMLKTKDADKVGEFSLTDGRFSRITKFMGETLYDENMGGKYGNTHIALGSAYKDSYPGDPSKVKKISWEKMGYNDSVVHTDIISTTDRTVTATLENGQELVIYKKGKFTI